MKELISIDLGYGNVKGKNTQNEVMFQSVIGPSRKLLDSTLDNKLPLKHIVDNKRKLFIGDLALKQSATKMFSLKESKAGHESTLPLLEVTLGLLSRSDHTKVVTGLPVTFYFQQKNELEKVFKSNHEIDIAVGKNIVKKVVCVEDVKIVPQPLGSALDFVLNESGHIRDEAKEYAKGRIGILDIGFYTNDLLVLDGLEVSQDLSRSLRSGMSVAYKAMNDAGIDLPIYELEKAVREGKYREAAFKAFQALARQIQGEVETYWSKLDLIIVTGGGGQQLYTYLNLPGETRLASQPVMSNVRGYHKLGNRVWGK